MDLFSENYSQKIDWPTFPSQFHSPTYEFDWFSACGQAFHNENDRCLITIGKDQDLRAIAPLCFLKKKGITWQEIMGVSKLYEPGGLIYKDEQSLHQLCHSILNKGIPTHLARLPANDPSIETIAKLSSKRGLLLKIHNIGSPYIEIDTDWENYSQKISPRRRQDYRRARRRLSKLGEVSVEFAQPNNQNLDQLLEEAFRVEQANWKGENGSAINCREDLKCFFTTYSRNLCDAGKLLTSSLRLDNALIAVQLLVQHANRWWILKIGFDDRLQKYSPGMQLMFDTIKEAYQRKLEAIEFLGTEEQWTGIWPHKTHQFISLVYFPYNLKGITALCLEGGSKVLTNFRQLSDSVGYRLNFIKH
jgi:CelD/BcsL family acetyltransferase involved in cellulose biosynthesis